MKKILIINGHPYSNSLNHELAEQYAAGAKEGGHEVRLMHLSDLTFDPILHGGYSEKMELEDDLKQAQDNLTWCDHLVIVTPMWWLGVPALLKGFFDRVLLPGFAFKFKKGQLLPYPAYRLMKGKSARVIYTSGSNRWLIMFGLLDSFWMSLRFGTLWYCGFGPVKRTVFHKIRRVREQQAAAMFQKVFSLGKRGK